MCFEIDLRKVRKAVRCSGVAAGEDTRAPPLLPPSKAIEMHAVAREFVCKFAFVSRDGSRFLQHFNRRIAGASLNLERTARRLLAHVRSKYPGRPAILLCHRGN